jgi:hypothetical protein
MVFNLGLELLDRKIVIWDPTTQDNVGISEVPKGEIRSYGDTQTRLNNLLKYRKEKVNC